ncbi:MAG TPA: hypothetical protein PK158_01800 [Spirochaetota bacterium]|nr:hypothetical protein [Spirochaetota bacterium]
MQVQTILMTSDEKSILEKCIRSKNNSLLIVKIAVISGLIIFLFINYKFGKEKYYYYFLIFFVSEILWMIFITKTFKKNISSLLKDSEVGIKEIITGTVSSIDKRSLIITIEDRKLAMPFNSINSVNHGDVVTVHVAKESGFPLKIEIVK